MTPSPPAVLYVDDEASNLVVFVAGLRGAVPLVTASGGAQALEIMRKQEIAVLVTDQRMPGMSGVDLLAAVRTEFPETVRMMMTAYSDLEAAIDSINRGNVHQYLRKPWEPVELRQALTQALARYSAVRWAGELERRMRETERMYSLGVVAAGVAHELRNPLTAISMNLELVEDLVDEPGERETLSAAIKDARQATRAISDIIASVELSTRSRPDGEVDLKEVVDMAARSVGGEARRLGQLDVSTTPVTLTKASRTKLGQVVVNLLVNALEAFDAQRRPKNHLTVSLTTEGGTALIIVADNGSGIAPDTLKRIFDPFFTTKVNGGTGLGLAISRQIVTEHGGAIEAHSELGKGTTFTVRLPIAPIQR